MKQKPSYSFEALGTQWVIETNTPLSESEKKAIQSQLRMFDISYSRFRDDSLVTAVSQEAGEYQFPESLQELWYVYETLHSLSGGAISPLVGDSLSALGYDAQYSLKTGETQRAPDLEIVSVSEGNVLKVEQPVLIDVGAIGKGFAVDTVADTLEQTHAEFVIDGSGDLRIKQQIPERIGLEDPRSPAKVIGYIDVAEGALCASATNRRAWGEGLHHIIDARTGEPAQNILATWAVAERAVIADALTTGLFFVSPDSLAGAFGDFRYVVLYADGSVRHNIGKEGEIFTS